MCPAYRARGGQSQVRARPEPHTAHQQNRTKQPKLLHNDRKDTISGRKRQTQLILYLPAPVPRQTRRL